MLLLLHRDSASGIPHLHAAVCRVDEFGYLNNDHQIHLRVQRAAERIAKRRGWATANSRHFDHIRQATEDCTEILSAMYGWKWKWYVTRLQDKGYDIRGRRDSKGILHGYTLRKGNVIIKASELRGRAFMVSRLENTWRKLNAQNIADASTQRTPRTWSRQTDESTRTSRMPTHQPQPTPQQSNRQISSVSHSFAPTPKQNYATLIDYTRYRPDTIPYTLEHDGKERRYYIPEKVMDLFRDEFDYRETINCQELTNFAVALFVGMAGGQATAPSGGGGGSPPDNNWDRDKDEDDLRWARRCAKAATQKLGKQSKYVLRR